jgi:hypothetical protein
VTGETEVLGGNLPQYRSDHHKSHSTRLRLEPGWPLLEAGIVMLNSRILCFKFPGSTSFEEISTERRCNGAFSDWKLNDVSDESTTSISGLTIKPNINQFWLLLYWLAILQNHPPRRL